MLWTSWEGKLEKLPDADKDIQKITVLSDNLVNSSHAKEHKKFRTLILVASSAVLISWLYIALLHFGWSLSAREFGWHAKPIEGIYTVVETDRKSSAAATMRVGDKILEINGDARVSRAGPRPKLDFLPKDATTYDVKVGRGGKQLNFRLEIGSLNIDSRQNKELVLKRALLIALPVVFGLAAWVSYLRPDLLTARLYFATFSLLTLVGLADHLIFLGPRVPAFVLRLRELLVSIFAQEAALGYFFASRFPVHLTVSLGWRFLDYFIGICAITVFLPRAFLAICRAMGEDLALTLGAWAWPLVQAYSSRLYTMELWYLAPWDVAFYAVCLTSIIVVLVRNRTAVREPDQRRRLEWIGFAMLCGVAPLIFVVILVPIDAAWNAGRIAANADLDEIRLYATLPIHLVVFILAYTIVSGRVVGFDFVAHRSLRYILAKNALRSLVFVPILGSLLLMLRNPDRTIGEFFVRPAGLAFAVLLVSSSLGLAFHDRINAFLNSTLFKERSRQEQTLRQLVQLIRHAETLDDLTPRIIEDISQALHPRCVLLYYRENEYADFVLLGSEPPGAVKQIQRLDSLLQFLSQNPHPQQPPHGKQVTLFAKTSLSETVADITLIVPLVNRDKNIFGILFLGEKESQEPYTKADLDSLSLIADQMSFFRLNLILQEQARHHNAVQHQFLMRDGTNLLRECPQCRRCFGEGLNRCPHDDAALLLKPACPKVVSGRYELEEVIGEGGMATVYRATDLALNRSVAVKLMLTGLWGGKGSIRFAREGQALAKLHHPHVVTVYDVGVIGAHAAYIVMELVNGTTLRERLIENRVIPPAVLAPMLDQVLDAVDAAHLAGIVHRDLKPENLLLSRHGSAADFIKVVDFGIAKLRDGHDRSELTSAGMIVGTAAYMAPEAYEGKGDERSDLFSIGVIAFESLIGVRPFDGRSYKQLSMSQLRQNFHFPNNSPACCALADVLTRGLQNSPGDRFQTAREMRSALIPVLAQPDIVKIFHTA